MCIRDSVKGAPTEVLAHCAFVMRDGVPSTLTEQDRHDVMDANDRCARDGLRVLAVAYRLLSVELSELSDLTIHDVEEELTFAGLVAMADPPRPRVAEAVALCRRAHIRIFMVTGDYGLTAASIAKQIGLVDSDTPRIISGGELEALTDADLDAALASEVIFARVAPEQKYRIVSRLKAMGEVVAVTGDGVNDAPALKKADIGVAMGITGTDVAKSAAEMVLLDDNFATIVAAVEEGRIIYDNIRRFIKYLLTCNVSEIAVMLIAPFLGMPLPLYPLQILWMNLVTDGLPALALGIEPPESDVMTVSYTHLTLPTSDLV